LHRANAKLVLDGVAWLDVADRVRRLLDQTGYAFVPLATDADGPVDGRPLAHGRGPLGADLREVVCEDVGGAAPVRAVDRHDRLPRQLHPRVRLGERGIVPAGDPADADAGQRLGR